MAGWSKLSDINDRNRDEKCQEKCNGRASSVNKKDIGKINDDNAGMSFDQVVLVLLRRLYSKNAIGHIPVLVRGGRSVDLFRLFCLVREKGGFNSVSRGYMWGLVAKNLDLDFIFSTSLQMVYFNHLGDLDQWLDSEGKDWKSKYMSHEYGMNFELLSMELEKRFRSFVVDDLKFVDGNKATCDDDENLRETEAGEADLSVGEPDPGSLERDSKRKREPEGWKEMLSWLNKIAKNPCLTSNGRMWNRSERKENDGKEYHSWVLSVREAMLERKFPNSCNDGCCAHQKQKMHPSMYDDPASGHLPGIRFSKRVPALAKSPKCPCCVSPLTKESKLENHSNAAQQETDPEDKEEKGPDSPASCSSEPTDDEPSSDELPVQKRVKVGPKFQAKIPPLTGEASEIDSKWLGTRVWPPSYNCEQQKAITVMQWVLGRGRPESCDCSFPGSVECVRFHTAENNLKLKHELGRAFYQWRFERSGEMVSLSWTPQEEEEFKTVMCSTSLSTSKPSYPNKTRQELVDYYFNVFLQRKRSYQNRVTPNDIDTDDELSYFGSVGGLYGQSATSTSGSDPGICTQNWDCSHVNAFEG